MEKFRIITARFVVPVNTQPGNPYGLTINLPSPIIKDISFNYWSVGANIAPTETGIRFSSAEGIFIPDMGSFDYFTNEVYVYGGGMSYSASAWLSGEINKELSGPPYNLFIRAYNLDAAQTAQYYVNVRVANKILLPPAPITNDQKEK